MSSPDKSSDKCIICDTPVTTAEGGDDVICRTCALAKRLLESPNDERKSLSEESSVAAAITNGILAGAVSTVTWIVLAGVTPWLPSFLWCFIIGGMISSAIRVKLPNNSLHLLAAGVGSIGFVCSLIGVYGVRLRYINELQLAQGLPHLPIWPGRETFIQVLTAGETPIGFAQLVVLLVAIAAGGIIAGVIHD